ncbi:Larval cuticle protein LCP-14 [Papilio machaon]|uniref:Larval cuticle protein LCP-14 n=1 Tax=Papilio machaon TaxID=76193 RepID=A0A0N1IG20_PAPMA|nr:Larval cuticle protein LCP-14 [Papilio machaon]
MKERKSSVNNKSVLLALCAIGCAYGLVPDQQAAVVRSDYQNSPEGYQYVYETENGISAHAEGVIKTLNKDEVSHTVQGSVSYIAPDGQKIETSYVADEFGYKPTGDHLPTTPPPMPIPDYILRALEWIATHPYKEPTSKN